MNSKQAKAAAKYEKPILKPLDIVKLEELRELCYIPAPHGEQFIHVDLNLLWGSAGTVRFGFRFKLEMGELDFRTLDEAIEIVKMLRKKAVL
jgi:hypothetical protein